MKKVFLLILIILNVVSCAGLKGSASTAVYENIPAGATVYLRSVTLKPEHILTDVSEELPELIKSCLLKSRFSVDEQDSAGAYKLDIVLSSRSWQYQYKYVESVTLSMRLYRKGRLAAFRLYTEDTDKSIDSFLWTFDLLERNIHELSLITCNEE